MLLMAKDSRGKGRPPKHQPARSGGRSGRRISLDIDPAVVRAMDAHRGRRYEADGLKLTRTQMIEMALIQLLKAAGDWPPK